MQASKYSRLNPQVQPDLTGNRIPENSEMQFNNSISYDRLGSPEGIGTENLSSVPKSQPRVQVQGDKAYANGLAYTGFSPDIQPKGPNRTRTNNSFYSVASSAWINTKQFAVSHFNVPKVAAPWEHELSEKQTSILQPSDTVRYFDHRRQRLRLFVNSAFQFFVTLFIAAALVSTLYGFSTLTYGITDVQKRLFNALVTGLSLVLGLNIVSSLRGYAQMMRWRFLASGYRTVQDFELVMNCDSQSKAFRLVWGGRTRGRFLPNKTQILAFSWITFNVAVQVFIALLGLTYSIDVSEQWVSLSNGTVSVANVSFIGDANTNYEGADDPVSSDPIQSQGATANSLGITGQNYGIYTMSFDTYETYPQSYYTDGTGALYWYRFIDRAVSKWTDAVTSQRTINATATCTELELTYGGYAGFNTDNASLANLVGWIAQDGTPMSYVVSSVATGATTWMANMSSDCGPRCMQVYALQSADNYTVLTPRLWDCQSNVSTVDGLEYYADLDVYKMPDFQASLFAGSIGLSGFVETYVDEDNNSVTNDLQMVRYPVDSPWSPSSEWNAADMAGLVMSFTAGAISALDENGPRANATGMVPGPAQVVKVKWKFSLLILVGVPLSQLIVLFFVIMFANKAIIKDTSHLSTARLLRPLVEKLGDNGCLLTGDEIAEKLGNVKVIYGVRDPDVGNVPAMGVGDNGNIRHLDILEESEGLGYRRGRMPVGMYDGIFPSRNHRGSIEAAEEEETVGLLSEQGGASTMEAHEQGGMWWKTRPKRQRRLSV
ncbi:uncharacterized protein A1O9_07797 [Exophiala aquamarina CBS 119918]|uniref:Uncharacterized protein n=1 Tax=Exophiala aquamarina CBS 119918 TaxID=1182545 RepID=A0A072P8N0_9EURO|nr:uncharacterized protein A1O9_07797 [Exophiala aquamarina CBS 119918]KEF56216.1 hypothetical protein A1O9_07797 [Exophiala aquamarina CBS 119918]